MKTKLEEGSASKIAVPRGKRDVMVFDTEQDGLFLRKFATAKAIYGVRYYVAGKARQKHLVEIVPGVNGLLAKARKMAGDVRAKARLGGDVLAEERTKRAAAKVQGETIEKLAKAFLAERKDQGKPRYRLEVERHLTKDWKPLAKTPIKAVTRQKIVDTLDGIAADPDRLPPR